MTETFSPPAPADSDTELADAASPDPEWQVGDWTFRPQLHRLSRDDQQLRLEPKVSDLLLFLVERARKPVSKDAIFEGVWEQRFLGDSALTRTMAELRRALGDDARCPSYVETIPKVGYRLIASVRRMRSTSIATEGGAIGSRIGETRGVGAQRDRLARVGVWVARPDKPPLPDGSPREDTIAALGIRLRKWVSFHGLSINVEPDLSHFDGIVPCGIRDHGVTSLVDLGLPVTMPDVDVALKKTFGRVFDD